MAMSHIEPLLLLLTSLFFLPAFRVRGLDFQYCNGTGHDFGSITSVEADPEISFGPDDIKTVTITVNGYADIASKSRNWSLVQVISKVNNYEALIASYDPCQLIECPVKPGTKFLLSLSNVRYFPDVVFVNKYASKAQ
ncbi:hypothetical protein AALP_AA7G000800 [Arabis alpina]|uniref:MD-2-related lipid-recognition domain-containing protein n=1 Tax=Arabis alpina TaxID=50452 RepID=A0A087GF21_ARAAL|nr:hypothetical protein AALP_AA7G000800 [Arabis alpina]